MSTDRPRVSICIPHWQVRSLITICLRSIRKHSARYDTEVIVVDNGSKDDSLDYLRSLKWIRLIERPEETHTNWPINIFTGWDLALKQASGDFFITMHSDVFVKSDDWLDPFLREMKSADDVAGVGAWKLNLEHPLYSFQKRAFGLLIASIKRALGRKKKVVWKQGHYPRDYCAMYHRGLLLRHGLKFTPDPRWGGGGQTIAQLIWAAGLKTKMVPVRELARHIVHIAHGTAAIAAEKHLRHKREQIKVERKVERLFSEDWVVALREDALLDG